MSAAPLQPASSAKGAGDAELAAMTHSASGLDDKGRSMGSELSRAGSGGVVRRVSETPLKIMVSKGFDDEQPPGYLERTFCGCCSVVLRLVLCGCIGSFLFGFNVSLLNTSLETIAVDYGWWSGFVGAAANDPTTKPDVYSAVVQTSVLVGAAIGAMTGGRMIFIGRRMVYLITMGVFTVGVITSVVADSFAALTWARFIVGYGVGVVSVVVPTYITEMTPANVRGKYGVFHQLFITVGIFIGVLVGIPLPVVPADSSGKATMKLSTFDRVWWRVMLGFGIIPVIVAIYFLTYVFPFETPHYYVENDKPEDAERLLKKLNNTNDVDSEMKALRQAKKDRDVAERTGLTLLKAAQSRVYLKVILVGCVLSAFQQLTGINVFITSSNKLFSRAKLDANLVTIMTNVLTFVNILMTFPSMYLIERLGRRTLLFIGTLGMACSVLPGAICLFVNRDALYSTWIAVSGAILFIVFFAGSYGPVLWVYLFEIYPLEIKGVASGLATAVNWVSAIVMVFVTQFLDVEVNYAIFCVASFIAAALVFTLMLETKGRNLQDSPYMVDKEGRQLRMNSKGVIV